MFMQWPTLVLNCQIAICSFRWGKSHGLLIEGGLTSESIIQSVANGNIAFREGVFELFEFLEVYFLSFGKFPALPFFGITKCVLYNVNQLNIVYQLCPLDVSNSYFTFVLCRKKAFLC